MAMRRLTAVETAVLIDEHLSNRTWMQHIQTYQRFARDVFGPEAASISLGLGLIYNDEDNVPGVATAAAYDAAGVPLEPLTPLPQGWDVRRVKNNPRVRVAERPVPIVALRVSKHHRP